MIPQGSRYKKKMTFKEREQQISPWLSSTTFNIVMEKGHCIQKKGRPGGLYLGKVLVQHKDNKQIFSDIRRIKKHFKNSGTLGSSWQNDLTMNPS